jgi:hypothetical protein
MKRKAHTLVIKDNFGDALHKNVTAGELERFTDEDLTKELERRAAIKREEAHQALLKRQQLIVDNVDVVLQLAPEHDRTSCSDKNHYNTMDCVRCWLLDVKESGIYDSRDLQLKLRDNEL